MSDQLWTAVIGLVGGGAGLKLIEWLRSRGDRLIDEGTSIRQELRAEIKVVRDDLDAVRAELDQWKEKYYGLLEEHTRTEARYQSMQEEMQRMRADLAERQQIETELERLRQENAALLAEITRLKANRPE